MTDRDRGFTGERPSTREQCPRESSLTTEVVYGVAEELGVEVEALPPISEYINPDALDALYCENYSEAAMCTVKFRYAGFVIEVIGPGSFIISNRDPGGLRR